MKTKRIGFTTSLPVEVLYAAGHFPIDLNNIFLSQDSSAHIHKAELKGFPRSLCSWIKGNFSSALSSDLDEVIGIVQGDCSNSSSLLEMIAEEEIDIYRFSFPPQKEYAALDAEISRLEEHYGVSRKLTLETKAWLDEIRRKLIELDKLCYSDRKVSGRDNHLWLVNSSDFQGDPARFERELDEFLYQARASKPLPTRLRLGYLGVPPIFRDLYDVISEQGGDVLFNEVQRQFSMPHLKQDIVEQYLIYTYPYSVLDRLKDIKEQIQLRDLQAIVAYTQAFCHLQIDNLLLKKHIKLPFLNLEGELPEKLDSRTILRLESFFEVHS
ncbi:MAG: 2-hydroxyacyl-CoA dehydratase [Candidatus Cloacimonadaceae bacterium]|nr:2-hydroxyacyl-CoA dehydratase [Candidatus Cloacimonadota bacterium]MDY0126609.1 2-hydroxyacyl-CoA dehydratase [Candidatus Cloacimonadaceae bacterium]MCB5255223.1 2-hydroxyacyl-CoA dehydratase [Candidatus Cloacimonadota bacterium]MCK9177445.1 2-hydroxyacyl-CoA dehydratase [Candidatus Cloacimonadota bacterium]MCK9241929.1 2-hydroxyacyl-CoA dehydratase [Candidatus Cloacimonadota bacterium]